jgi:predicted secreted Zn-dependent protease
MGFLFLIDMSNQNVVQLMNVEVNWNGKNVLAKYKLKGKTTKAILKELNAREEWGKFDGKLKGRFSSNSGTKSFNVELFPESKIIMPVWPAYSRQTSKVQQNWDEVYAALRKHEDGHAVIFEEGVASLKARFEGMTETNQKDFNKILNEWTESNQREHDSYDSKTNHGKDNAPQLMTE